MDDTALEMFHTVCLANIDALHTLPSVLPRLGFVETQRLSFKTGPEDTSILFQHPDTPFAFACFERRKDWPCIVSLVVPDTPQARAVFLAFVRSQPSLNETTRQVWKRTAWFPPPRHGQFAKGRFWSAKSIGARGMDLGILPSLFPLNGVPAVELSLERNLQLLDRPSPAEKTALMAQATPLQKMVRLFKSVAVDHAPDVQAIADAARAQGFVGQDATSNFGMFCGGNGPDSNPMDNFVNFEINNYNKDNKQKFDIEVALSFNLPPEMTPEQIRGALFRALGTASTNKDDCAPLMLKGEAYSVTHLAVSEVFGRHYFLLQK